MQYSGVVLFPGATLPLRVIESNFVAAVEKSLSRVDVPYTIGVVGKFLTINACDSVMLWSLLSFFSKHMNLTSFSLSRSEFTVILKIVG